jgi:hypothetical protein
MAIIEIDSGWCPTLLDLSRVEGAFSFAEGFSRPDWKVIGKAVEEAATAEGQQAAWTDAAIQWVLRLQADLGGDYRVRCSKEFILLSNQESESAKELLRFAEGSLQAIYWALKEAAWRSGRGKHVVLLFAEDADYFRYVSFFFKDGIHPASGGVLIPQGYIHIAGLLGDGRHVRPMLAHELTHNSVVHLGLPLWLNEGLAMLFSQGGSDWQRQALAGDLRDRHLAFWNAQTIQRFWSGVSFDEPGESNELSYGLAEILVRLLVEKPGEFRAFLQQAKRGDGGQAAAIGCLGQDLGQVAGIFLGEGDWQPCRETLVECWEAAKKENTQAQVGGEAGGGA